MEAEIGYIVSDLVITGPNRGGYQVWIPKKHGDPTSKSSYNGFGTNFGNLGSAELTVIREVAEYCFPIMPLTSGGHMPFDDENGLTSGTESNSNINIDTVPTIGTNGYPTPVKNLQFPQGTGTNYKFRQTNGANSLSRVYAPDFVSGTTANVRENTPASNYVRLSIGTKVAISGNIILGQLLQTNNDIINQLRPLNNF